MTRTIGHIPPDMTLSKAEIAADRAAWDELEAKNKRLIRVLDWIVRVAGDPGAYPDMALRRIVEEGRKAMSASQ